MLFHPIHILMSKRSASPSPSPPRLEKKQKTINDELPNGQYRVVESSYRYKPTVMRRVVRSGPGWLVGNYWQYRWTHRALPTGELSNCPKCSLPVQTPSLPVQTPLDWVCQFCLEFSQINEYISPTIIGINACRTR
jgi:hypothetical protein